MKRSILVFGAIAGAIVSTFMAISMALMGCSSDGNMTGGMIIGFSSMAIAFSFVFVGIKNYRDKQNGGVLTFGKGFLLGFMISFVASTMYVITWAIEFHYFLPDFMDKYSAIMVKQTQESGISGAELAEALKKVTSPFVRLWVKNPRYEKVNFCLRVKLMPGKDEVYYKEKLRQDIREFLAPWAIGEFSKLTFGQPINRSDIIRFLESRDYIDYIIDLRMIHADKGVDIKSTLGEEQEIVPITPRSILIAGSIDVCIDPKDCETWCICKDEADKIAEPCCDHEKIPIMQYCVDQPGS